MVWFFERADETIEIETRYDNSSKMYLLERRMAGKLIQIERFPTAAEFRQRLVALETTLSGQHWRLKGQPVILADGWPDETPQQ
jgi:hypothetical protein